MTAVDKESLWTQITGANPHWLTDGPKLTPAGVRKLFDAAFDAGARHGRARAEEEQAIGTRMDDVLGRFKDLFKPVGGNGREGL